MSRVCSKGSWRTAAAAVLLSAAFVFAGCRPATEGELSAVPRTLADVPADRLSFRLETDVAEEALPEAVRREEPAELIPAIKADFEGRRGNTEALIRTVLDPTRQRALAVYGTSETDTDFRIDLYSAEGAFIRNVLPVDLTGVFPTEVAWSPDGRHIAFAGIRNPALPAQGSAAPTPDPHPPPADLPPVEGGAPLPAPTVAPLIPSVQAFRTEQVYVGDRDGFNLRPLTAREGLIYFKLEWSPDGNALAALAAREDEWEARRAESFLPAGRPRLITLEGRERLLDDRATPVAPVWSPDGAKVATAFDYDVAVYDAADDSPTGGSLALHEQLRAASAAYDARVFAGKEEGRPETAGANGTPQDVRNASPVAEASGAAGGETVIISLNPVVRLEWGEAGSLYAQTAFVRFYRDESLPTFKYARWHLVRLYPQAVVVRS